MTSFIDPMLESKRAECGSHSRDTGDRSFGDPSLTEASCERWPVSPKRFDLRAPALGLGSPALWDGGVDESDQRNGDEMHRFIQIPKSLFH